MNVALEATTLEVRAIVVLGAVESLRVAVRMLLALRLSFVEVVLLRCPFVEPTNCVLLPIVVVFA